MHLALQNERFFEHGMDGVTGMGRREGEGEGRIGAMEDGIADGRRRLMTLSVGAEVS